MRLCDRPARVMALSLLLWSTSAAALVTADSLNARTAEVESSSLDAAQKQQILAVYKQAQAFVSSEVANTATAERDRRGLARGPEARKELLSRIAELEQASNVPAVTQRERTLDVTALEHLLDATRTERATLEGKLSSYELRLRAMRARPAAIAEAKLTASARLTTLDADATDSAPDDLGRAHAALVEAESAARQAELDALTQEALSHANREESYTLKREVTVLALQRLSARTTALEELLIERRQAQTENAQADAEHAAVVGSNAPLPIQRLAQENAELSAELTAVITGQSSAVQSRAEYAERRQQIAAELAAAQQRLTLAGTSATLGRILVDQRRRLPALNTLLRQSRTNVNEVSRMSLRRIEIDDRQRTLRDSQQNMPAYLAHEFGPAAPSPESAAHIKELLRAEQDMLTNLDANYASWLRVLGAADLELDQLIAGVTAYSELLDRRLLWIPNASALDWHFMTDSIAGVRELGAAHEWRNFWRDVVNGWRASWLRTSLWVFALGVLLRMRDTLRRRIRAVVELRTMHGSNGRLRDIMVSLGLTTVCALPLPLLGWVLAAVLRAAPDASDLTLAFAAVLSLMSYLGVVAAWCGEALREDGLTASHLALPAAWAHPIRAAWWRASACFIPSYSLAVAFEWTINATAQYELRRGLFFIAMGTAAYFGDWLTRRRAVALPFVTGQQTRLRWALFVLTVLPPLVLIGISAAGYHYTAVRLSRAYLLTMLSMASAALSYALGVYWLRNAEERLRMAQAISLDANQPEVEHAGQELDKFNAQAELVLRNVVGWSLAAGFFWIWVDLLPALTVFDQISLWNIESTDAAGATKPQSITLTNLVLAMVLAAITVIASRNIPGVLEIGLLQRLKVNRGSRYAITSLLQYAIVALGISLALSKLGLRWSQVQWLVAALGVGLGFGLQEIFANFISGLILLFERPIRVGDVVTIGEMSGKVTRIQIRATTLRDIDNKEMVVPNKTFITERFLNWTLSDQVTRIVLTVGVAYGTDIELAERLLLEAANAHPKVMKDPAPQAILTTFGDSALMFELHVYAEELSHRADVRHALNAAIYRAFAAHGIDIPVPQREVRLHRNARGEVLGVKPA